jgi:hypothetical protein
MAKQGWGKWFNGQGERGGKGEKNKDEHIRYGKATKETGGKEINIWNG